MLLANAERLSPRRRQGVPGSLPAGEICKLEDPLISSVTASRLPCSTPDLWIQGHLFHCIVRDREAFRCVNDLLDGRRELTVDQTAFPVFRSLLRDAGETGSVLEHILGETQLTFAHTWRLTVVHPLHVLLEAPPLPKVHLWLLVDVRILRRQKMYARTCFFADVDIETIELDECRVQDTFEEIVEELHDIQQSGLRSAF